MMKQNVKKKEIVIKKKLKKDKQQNEGILLKIDRPVLEDYRYFGCKKIEQTSRIKHKFHSINEKLQNQETLKWEDKLKRYMQAKQRHSLHHHRTNSSFKFFQLSKINLFKQKKLFVSYQISSQAQKKYSSKSQADLPSINKITNRLSQRQKEIVQSQRQIPQDGLKCKILKRFVMNYFQKKIQTLA